MQGVAIQVGGPGEKGGGGSICYCNVHLTTAMTAAGMQASLPTSQMPARHSYIVITSKIFRQFSSCYIRDAVMLELSIQHGGACVQEGLEEATEQD